jgi:hypothetical protein
MEASRELGNPMEEVRQEVMTIPDQAKLILVRDQASMTRASEFFLVIKGLRKKIEDTFGPIISKAFAAHKEAVAQRKKVEEPLVIAENWLNGQMTAYHQEQERIRKAEEDRLRKEALEAELKRRQEEEERKMAEAAALEASGAKDEAEQLMNEAIQLKEEPLTIEHEEPPTPRVETKGIAMVTYWKFRITNESLIPRSYLVPDEEKIGGVVRAMKDKTNIPGIQAYPETKSRSTGR